MELKINSTWHFIQTLIQLPESIEAPLIYFSPFDRDIQEATWTEWQSEWIVKNPEIWNDWVKLKNSRGNKIEITDEWVKENQKILFPFPAQFLAFHYDRTTRIQINQQKTFLRFYQNDYQGIKKDFVGYGFYVSAHEMLHYALEQIGIKETKLHHCMYVLELVDGKTLIDHLADFLVAHQISSHVLHKYGVESEKSMNQCHRLNQEEQNRARELLNNLQLNVPSF